MKRVSVLWLFIFSSICIVHSQNTTGNESIKTDALENIIKSEDAAYKANYFQAVNNSRRIYGVGNLDQLIIRRDKLLQNLHSVIIIVFVLFMVVLCVEWMIVKKRKINI